MAHTFLALDMALIPQSTKDNVPTFYSGVFSSDNSKMLIDGYNEKRELVHTSYALASWLQWSSNPQEIISQLLSTAIEYTTKEIQAERLNVNSTWYVEPEELI